MGFEIIKAEQRTANMVGWFSGICGKVTDFLVGSVFRSKFEAVAVEMESQDFAFYTALRKVIPVSVYNAFNFTLQPAVAASDLVVFTADQAPLLDVVIPAGTLVASETTSAVQGNSYVTVNVVTLLAGQTSVQGLVECTVPGASGNTEANTINTMRTVIPGIDSVNNQASFTSGQDIETETERRSRFLVYISTLSRGTNAAVEFGALTSNLTDGDGNITESVAYSKCIDAPSDEPAGSGTCYVTNNSGAISGPLIANTQKIINGYTTVAGVKVPGWKAAGAKITVAAATTVNHACALVVTKDPNVSDIEALEAQVLSISETYLQSGGIGDSYIYNEHVQRVMDLPGVVDVEIAPAGNVTPATSSIIRPGVVTVTVQ